MHRSVPVFFTLIGASLFAAPLVVSQELPPPPPTQTPLVQAAPAVDPKLAPRTLPEGVSPDGNRWVEVEMTVFRAETNNSNEQANPGRLKLSYFPKTRLLALPLDSYAYPFEADRPPAPTPEPTTLQFGGAQPLDALLAQQNASDETEEAPQPEHDFDVPAAPAQPGSFKVLDLARDPYVRLDAAAARFGGMDRNLEQSPEYQVLWHEVWRQPLLDSSAVAAVAVEAGETQGEHTALEGSVRISRNGERAHLYLNLWLSEFGVNSTDDAERWQLPAIPEAARPKQPEPATAVERAPGLLPLQSAVEDKPATPERRIVRIWQLQGVEELAPSELRYLDHPVLGVLIEARPYLVPELVEPNTTEDF